MVLAGALGPKAGVTLPASVVLAVAQALEAQAPPVVERLGTVDDVARHFGVAPSTARGWLADGRVPGARCVPRLGWRFELSQLVVLEQELGRDEAAPRLSDWRATDPSQRRSA